MEVTKLEKRFYPLAEIREIIGSKRKETITGKLGKWGYGFNWRPQKGVEIVSAPEEDNPEQQLKSLLMRKIGLDVQTDFKAFAVMFYLFCEDELFMTTPWEARAKQIKEEFGIEISERTLRSYMSKLIKEDIVIKDDNCREYWRTTYICGIEKVQEPVTYNEEAEMQEWFNKRSQYLKDADELYQEAMQMSDVLNPQRWKIALRKLWEETKTVYYPVKGFVFNGFHDKDVQEIYKLSALVIADVEVEDAEIDEKVIKFNPVDDCIGVDGGFVF